MSWNCPETVQLADGSWVDAPYIKWVDDYEEWKCFVCNTNTGVTVTIDHLACGRHKARTDCTGRWHSLGSYTRELGQKIIDVQVDDEWKLPSPPAAPAGGPLALPAPQQDAPAPSVHCCMCFSGGAQRALCYFPAGVGWAERVEDDGMGRQ